MTRIIALFISMLALFPSAVLAHATPLSSVPESSSKIAETPERIEIRFSERLDEGASSIVVKNSSGETVSLGRASVDVSDPRLLRVDLKALTEGPYIVTWSVVSSDDGHFTKGSYPFVVGSAALPDIKQGDLEVVQITTAPEAAAMTVELFGNGLIWAAILVFAFAIRSILKTGLHIDLKKDFKRLYDVVLSAGVVLALTGTAAQILLKSYDLSWVQEIVYAEALQIYISTTAGSATFYRMLAVIAVGAIYFFARSRITSSNTFTLYEYLMVAGMSVFAFYRAIISHATANPFFPELSVAVNIVHLVEKDFWAGAALMLATMVAMKRFRAAINPLVTRISTMLTANLALVSITATYIVWLHLKDFGNLFSTLWGERFAPLIITAVLLAGMRLYHVVTRRYRPQIFSNLLPATAGAEFALALMVVFYSSAVIITSPPLPTSHGPVYSESSEGVKIELRATGYEDGMALVTFEGALVDEPAITVSGINTEPISIESEKRFSGGYVFPLSLIASNESRTVSIRAPQEKGYDAKASFDILPGSYVGIDAHTDARSFDGFTIIMMAIGAFGFMFSLFALRISRMDAQSVHLDRSSLRIFLVITGTAIGILAAAGTAAAYAALPISNPYKARCEYDGNMWHLMLPMKAGIPLSETPREGCMWGMGNYQYMFPDSREYEYVSTFPESAATISFDSQTLVSGREEAFTVSIRHPDGSPTNLFVDMEKLVHVVIVSADQTVFAHIHPDDTRPLTQEEIDTSTFRLSYVFPKGGEYLISIDYANGIHLENSRHRVVVQGPAQAEQPALYATPVTVAGYQVSFKYPQPFAGEVATVQYEIRKDGEYATLMPYLSAAAHIAVVKNDLSQFVHTHGEYHAPGTVVPPVIVREGKIVHSMAAMYTPPEFSGPLDAHIIFPDSGQYTVWTQFKTETGVYAVPFTVMVEK